MVLWKRNDDCVTLCDNYPMDNLVWVTWGDRDSRGRKLSVFTWMNQTGPTGEYFLGHKFNQSAHHFLRLLGWFESIMGRESQMSEHSFHLCLRGILSLINWGLMTFLICQTLLSTLSIRAIGVSRVSDCNGGGWLRERFGSSGWFLLICNNITLLCCYLNQTRFCCKSQLCTNIHFLLLCNMMKKEKISFMSDNMNILPDNGVKWSSENFSRKCLLVNHHHPQLPSSLLCHSTQSTLVVEIWQVMNHD